jgi:serine/threonine-protein kinase RsbW
MAAVAPPGDARRDRRVGTKAQPAEVRLTIPADGAYVAVPRAVVGNLAARNDFTLDAIDDLRIAVDEACALLLPHASDGIVECVFSIDRPVMVVAVSARVPKGWHPDTSGFGWMVLSALVDSAKAETTGDRLSITVTSSALTTENA